MDTPRDTSLKPLSQASSVGKAQLAPADLASTAGVNCWRQLLASTVGVNCWIISRRRVLMPRTEVILDNPPIAVFLQIRWSNGYFPVATRNVEYVRRLR